MHRWATVWEFSIAHPIFHSPWATGRVIVFMPGQIGYIGFSIEKVKTVDFSETIAASDLKVGRSRHLIEYMKVCEY